MLKTILIICSCFGLFVSLAQDPNRVQEFEKKIAAAVTDAEKITAFSKLAEYYSVFREDAKADSILQKSLSIAETSENKELLLGILFENKIEHLDSWSSKATYERLNAFIQKGLQYAQELNRPDYIAQAYILLAGNLRRRGQYDAALQQVTQAYTALSGNGMDSIRFLLYKELGDIYLAKGDAVSAFKNYNSAYEIAYREKNNTLQSEIYHRFSGMYFSLADSALAKKYLLLSLQGNQKYNDLEGQYKDYIDLARITDNTDYIEKARNLAGQLHSDRYQMSAERLLFFWKMINGKNSRQTFDYLYSNPGLVQYFENTGQARFNWHKGNIYRYAAQYDSALYYYKKAEQELIMNYDPNIKLSVTHAMGETYLLNHDLENGKIYFEAVYGLSRQLQVPDYLPEVCDTLKRLYAATGDYKKAFDYLSQSDSAAKLIQSKTAKDKLVLLQVEQEKRNRENDLLEAEAKTKRKHNLQIMAITVTITVLFIFMLFLGMFAVSKTTIRMVGYFAFISLFEFIIVLLDHPIMEISKGEPLKIWGIKIGVIALLVPVQHFLEHRLIAFLQSRKLLEARQKISLKNWWYRLRKPAPPKKDAGMENMEDDTAVL
jgi:lipopolysaccharide biosynthesis regulator YciM